MQCHIPLRYENEFWRDDDADVISRLNKRINPSDQKVFDEDICHWSWFDFFFQRTIYSLFIFLTMSLWWSKESLECSHLLRMCALLSWVITILSIVFSFFSRLTFYDTSFTLLTYVLVPEGETSNFDEHGCSWVIFWCLARNVMYNTHAMLMVVFRLFFFFRTFCVSVFLRLLIWWVVELITFFLMCSLCVMRW